MAIGPIPIRSTKGSIPGDDDDDDDAVDDAVPLSSELYGLVDGFVAIVITLIAVVTASRQQTSLDVHTPVAATVPGRLAGYVERRLDALESVIGGAGALLDRRDQYWLYAISFVLWVVYPLKIYVVASTIGVETTLTVAFVGTYLAYLVSLVPVSPGGTGTFEGALALIFLVGWCS